MLNMKYKFVDMTGHCFQDYGDMEDHTSIHKSLKHILQNKKEHSTCSTLIIRYELIREGFVLGEDFGIENATVPIKSQSL